MVKVDKKRFKILLISDLIHNCLLSTQPIGSDAERSKQFVKILWQQPCTNCLELLMPFNARSGWLEKTLCANEVISPSLRYEFEFFFKICSRRRLTSKSSVCRRLTDESSEESAALGFRGIGGARVRRSCGDNGENEVR
ncbi:hypothetical protein YC2023_015848 [Brassica napus]